MIKEKKKKDRRIFVAETIGTRKYLSYRVDLILYKIILCTIIFIIIYILTSKFIFSLFISLQVFLIFTLINKLNVERKEKEGKKIIINKIKKEYIKKKLDSAEITRFENLIKYFFEKQEYINCKRIGKHMFSVEMKGEIFYIKVFKLFDEAEVEKIDVRSFASFINGKNTKNGFLVTNNVVSEDANKFIDKINKNMNISIVDADKLYDLIVKYNLLPPDDFFYDKINTEKARSENRNIIKNNALSNKKIIIYLVAAIFFYMTSKITPYNNLQIYISYYFVILTIISVIYCFYLKIYNRKTKKS